MNLRIGISGWTYAPWRGTFFPKGLKQREELEYASSQLNSIEINGTFYGLQRPAVYKSWAARTPDDFVFSVKAPRFVTHIQKLREVEKPIANFFASGPLTMGEKLGPILWQLPPSLAYDHELIAHFLGLLPRDTLAAAKIAGIKPGPRRPLRHALEVRHHSFKNAGFIALLREHNVALVVADTAGKWPRMEDVTADFVYVRLHGHAELYVSGYTPALLKAWAKKILTWSRGKNPRSEHLNSGKLAPVRAAGRDVFVYFDNDVKTRSPYDAMTLAFILKLGPKPAEPPSIESISEQPRAHWPAYRESSTKKPKQTELVFAKR